MVHSVVIHGVARKGPMVHSVVTHGPPDGSKDKSNPLAAREPQGINAVGDEEWARCARSRVLGCASF